jgi:hypothetical protein
MRETPATPVKKILLLSASLLAALSASATVVNVSGANGEQTLQQIVAGTSINVNTSQLAADSYYNADSLQGAMVIEIAGYAPNNSFGIFEQGNSSNKIEVFAGSAAAGATSALINLPLGWTGFGFYLANTSANFVWYTDAALNGALQYDHFVTYKGGPITETLTASGITFGANDYLIGIEDLNLGDYDYNDMVVKVHLNVTPTQHNVPDTGATLALMGLGLAALVAVRRRQN